MKHTYFAVNFILSAAILLGSQTATADDGRDPSQRDHKFQGVVNITTGTGWYMVAPYEKNDLKRILMKAGRMVGIYK